MKKYCCYLFLCILFSCDTKEQTERPSEVNMKKLREETGGTPSESSYVGKGRFFSPYKGCNAGFGICEIILAQPDPDKPQTPDPARDEHPARFTLAPGENVLTIAFNTEMPNFEEQFIVAPYDTLKNTLGHKYIVLVPGNYKASKNNGEKYGEVKIKVVKGPESSIYYENK